MKQKKTNKRTLWKVMWADKSIRISIYSILAVVALLIICFVIPEKKTITREGHTLQVYSTTQPPVHDPILCDKCRQEAAKKDTVEYPYE